MPSRPGRVYAARSAWVRRHGWFFAVLIPVVVLAILFGYPLYEMLRRSFTEFLSPTESGLANYHWFFGTHAQVVILRRTITSALLTTGIALGLGFPFAYLMTVVSFRWRMVMLAVVLMRFWTSLIVRTYAWVVLFQEKGPILDVIRALGLGSPRLLGTTTAVVIGMTQIMLPFMILPLYSHLTRIDRGLLQAAQGLGATPAKAFRVVYLPLAVPGILTGATIVFILSLGFYFTPALLGSPQNSMLSQQIVEQVTKLLAFGRGGAMALVLLVITLLLLGVGALVSRRSLRALGIGEVQR